MTMAYLVRRTHVGAACRVGMVSAQTSYIPTFFPVWGNAATFSWEPYYERTVQMGIPERCAGAQRGIGGWRCIRAGEASGER